jgi:hypothetical protein
MLNAIIIMARSIIAITIKFPICHYAISKERLGGTEAKRHHTAGYKKYAGDCFAHYFSFNLVYFNFHDLYFLHCLIACLAACLPVGRVMALI